MKTPKGGGMMDAELLDRILSALAFLRNEVQKNKGNNVLINLILTEADGSSITVVVEVTTYLVRNGKMTYLVERLTVSLPRDCAGSDDVDLINRAIEDLGKVK